MCVFELKAIHIRCILFASNSGEGLYIYIYIQFVLVSVYEHCALPLFN